MEKTSDINFQLPFKKEWFVVWGGDTKKLNQHHDNQAQKYAFDFVILKKGKSYRKSPDQNENYYCFHKKIFSPAKGIVVQVVDGIEDNEPGYINGYWMPGNTIVIKHAEKVYSFLAHLSPFTIKVKVGDKVKSGDNLGLCGNSGRSSEPHLHFHLQDNKNILFAKGIKCFFNKKYSPVKGDSVGT